MNAISPSVPISAEARGLARLFCARVSSDDVSWTRLAGQIMLTCEARMLRGKRSLRPEMALALRRMWESRPLAFSLASNFEASKSGMMASDLRISRSEVRLNEWEDGSSETGLTVLCARLAMLSPCEYATRLHCVVGFHALARRFQRASSSQRTTDAVIRDLAVLPDVADGAEEVWTPSGGRWVGFWRVCRLTHEAPQRLLWVRTFLDA